MYEDFAWMYVCMCAMFMPGAHDSQKVIEFPGKWDTGASKPPRGKKPGPSEDL